MVKKNFSKRMPLELLCLTLLKERDMYGYEMVQEIEKRSEGMLFVNITTLYVTLKKMAEKGFVSLHYQKTAVTRERLRIYYHAEQSASSYYQELYDEYLQTTQGVSKFFGKSK